MRHGSSCYDMLSAVPPGIACLRSVAFVRCHGCLRLSQMAVSRAHVFFSDSGSEATKMTYRRTDVLFLGVFSLKVASAILVESGQP